MLYLKADVIILCYSTVEYVLRLALKFSWTSFQSEELSGCSWNVGSWSSSSCARSSSTSLRNKNRSCSPRHAFQSRRSSEFFFLSGKIFNYFEFRGTKLRRSFPVKFGVLALSAAPLGRALLLKTHLEQPSKQALQKREWINEYSLKRRTNRRSVGLHFQ